MGTKYSILQDGNNMIKNDPKIVSLMYGNMVEDLMKSNDIGIDEARKMISEMSFLEYRNALEATLVQPSNDFSTVKATYPNPSQVQQTAELEPGEDEQMTMKKEDITPPSGDTIGPSSSGTNTGNQTTSSGTSAPAGVTSLWPGHGAPVSVGMTVGLKGPEGLPVPGQITQVDNGAKGAKVRNPTTGQEEWANLSNLQPYMAQGGKQSQPAAPAQPNLNQQMTTEDDEMLLRLRELAGIKETCSAGATGAGSIAIAPSAMGNIKRRSYPVTELKTEYTPKEAAKTIIGDTKPNQASGELSANLAASGKSTASRINNGRKRRR